ncbi:MAG: DNA polymerase III subunit alpha [Acidimicrobiia bacterium]
MPSAGSFTHLHTHTEYSMLDGASRVKELVAAAAADGQPALGITDHGNMYGALDFYKACRDAGVNPVIGIEAYQAAESRFERPVRRGRMDDGGGEGAEGEKLYYHLCLLAETTEGYRNLIKLSSAAYLDGYFYKPRVDWELLERYSQGVMATTGCLGGVVLQALLRGEQERALALAGRLQDIFGRDNLFVELQDHGLAKQRQTNPQLVDIARRLQAPLLATNDSHYTRPEDSVAQDALLCVQTGAAIDDPKRFRFESDQHWLKSAAEMRALFADVPEACDNTLLIAERANVEIEFGRIELPRFPLPDGFASDDDYLRHLATAGAKERYGDPIPAAAAQRLHDELAVIADMGLSAYFLVVWDLIRHARERGIRVGPGRGSAAGCCVAYCLRIVDLDPIRYGLIFERFLNAGRKEMPDIDMDFDERYRGEMIRYAAERYGSDHVAQIVTFSTIKARAAVRDASRVLGYPYAVGDRIAKLMPPLIMGRDTPLAACLEPVAGQEDGYKMAGELRALYEVDPDAKKVIDVAKGLEGLRRQDGIHAAAVVITREPLTEYLPIQRKPEPGGDPANAPVVTQYEMNGVAGLGLLKMDFLGLRNLTVIERALDLISETTGERLDIDAIPLDDEKTFEMLRAGDSIGVFQLEGGPMRALMRSLAPTCFDDIGALVALYRPGPMAANMHNDFADRKNGRKPVTCLHPELEELLADTHGLMIYQESMMRVAERFAGYSLQEADNLRKACLPAGTLVLTRARGYVPIERVMDLHDRTLQTIDTASCTTRFEPVEDVWPVGVKPVYELTTSTGYTIRATAEHPFLVEDEWRELGQIKPGDLVGVAARTASHGGSRISTAEIELAALLISEGFTPDVRREHMTGFFCNTDQELVDTFLGAFERFFGRAHAGPIECAGVSRVNLRKSELLALLPVLGSLGRSADKVINRRLVNAPLHKIERFLGLYFCADGWADRSGMHFASKSKAVCRGLKRMLLRCGIVSNLCRRTAEGDEHWTLSVADKGQAKAFVRVVEPHLTSRRSAKVGRWLAEWSTGASATNIGIPASFLSTELARRQAVTGRTKRQLGVDTGGYCSSRVLHRETLNGLLYSERLEDLRSGDLVWDTVTSMEYVGDLQCFDFRMANPDRPYAVVEDFLVHNCGKKIRALIALEREKFVAGCERTGYGADLGTKLFDLIEPFADYAFNKSHAYAYGMVAYQTAWLKANHPVEYLAALLTSVKDDKDKTAVYLAECRNRRIPVNVPDINRSASDFTSVNGEIVFGMSAIRNVGEGLVGLIVAEREKNGPFVDFYDFCQRVDPAVLNKRSIESLVKAGAFDSLGHPRAGLMLVFERIIDGTLARRREEAAGVQTLFGEAVAPSPVFDEKVPVPADEWPDAKKLAFEKEMLGLYISSHPLDGVTGALRRHTEATLDELRELRDGECRWVGGVVTALQRKYTKRGDLMAVFTLEDLVGAIEVMVFPRTMLEYGALLADDAVVCVKGRLDLKEEPAKLICLEVKRPDLSDGDAPPVRIKLAPNFLTDSVVGRLKSVLQDHPGDTPVFLHLDKTVLRLPDNFRVDSRNGLFAELRVLLGPNGLVV